MRIGTLILCITLLLPQPEALAGWRLNEVMINPLGPESSEEFVELYHAGSDSLPLAGWRLEESGAEDGLLADPATRYAPGSRVLLLDPGYAGGFDSLLRDNTLVLPIDNSTFGNGGLSNSRAGDLRLLDPQGETRDRVTWPADGPAGRSFERSLGGERPADCSACWNWSLHPGGSPGFRNSRLAGPHELHIAEVGSEGLLLRVTGVEGFSGELRWVLESGTRLEQSGLLQTSLAAGAEWSIPWPTLPRAGLNHILLEARAGDESQEVLDSLLWRTASRPPLRLNELRPDDPRADWAELRSLTGDSLRLRGLFLAGHRDTVALGGEQAWLPPGSFLLAGGFPEGASSLWSESALPGLLSDEGLLQLQVGDGRVLDEVRWRKGEHPEGRSLERAPDGGWHFCLDRRGHTAGRANSLALPEGLGGFGIHLGRKRFRPSLGEVLRLELLFPQGHQPGILRLYDSAGRERRRLHRGAVLTPRAWLSWDGRDEKGILLPPGLYLLHLDSPSGTDLETVILLP